MSKFLRFVKSEPMLPIVVAALIPAVFFWKTNQPAGNWIIAALVVWTVIDIVRTMIEDIKNGHAGVDILAVMALISTACVHEFLASWAVVLMVYSGGAIENYANSKAESNLNALMSAAPQVAHVLKSSPDSASGSSFASAFEHPASEQSASDRSVSAGSAGSVSANDWKDVAADEVQRLDILVVKPGETVPVDGTLLSESATLDLSMVNGEPVPRTVYTGQRVVSGSVNADALFTMRSTELARDSQYQKILDLVKSAQESRPAVVKTADLLAVPFTVISLMIAGIAWFMSAAPMRFAQVLVLATPCPLLIAAPVAYMAGTGRLAKAGILIKLQDVLENLGRVTHVFFDKTGTLTVKQPQVTGIDRPGLANKPSGYDNFAKYAGSAKYDSSAKFEADNTEIVDGFTDSQILALAGIVETYSIHILSKGIAKAGERELAKNPDINPSVSDMTEASGSGVSGEVDGHSIRVGRFDFVINDDSAGFRKAGYVSAPRKVRAEKIRRSGHAVLRGNQELFDFSSKDTSGKLSAENPVSEKASVEKASVEDYFAPLPPDCMSTYVSVDGKLAARIVLKDLPRDNAKQAIEDLRDLGVKELTMLTGDKSAAAQSVASQVGITDVHSELFPEQKEKIVRQAGKRSVKAKSGFDSVIEKLSGEDPTRAVTMMVGDGVNDAPVLAASDIGMAITDGSSTAASESALAVIMNDDISSVPRAVSIARRTKKVMIQAVLAGIILAIVGMVCAAFNLIPVVIGAFLQEGIDVVSILWALTALIDKD